MARMLLITVFGAVALIAFFLIMKPNQKADANPNPNPPQTAAQSSSNQPLVPRSTGCVNCDLKTP
ncbi:MAG: hypothetical protein IT429_02110 [Gemmataceae bacterium]|nr:hypothetical protein [Gemmataceae bacterium]